MFENDLILIKIFIKQLIITTLKSGVNRQLISGLAKASII